ncbi:unnamed protein product [Sphagnum troendelagicum]|uniref:Peptidase A2 domain-containing protein n=1 Tax=Sphagnum troendelagicum TaxID=128251 RepID=A0ABP0V1I4_9BRYO
MGDQILGRQISLKYCWMTKQQLHNNLIGELEQLENLVKVARRKKDAETEGAQVSMVSAASAVRRICVNRTHRSKTLHLSVEINSYLIEGLVDTGASMSIMAAAVVRELGLMHMVSGSETYKTASDADGAAQLEGQVEGESEFGDTELEKLVMLEGPQQILQLTLQNQADEFMKEEITDADDYAD